MCDSKFCLSNAALFEYSAVYRGRRGCRYDLIFQAGLQKQVYRSSFALLVELPLMGFTSWMSAYA
jgi:hypothetical protein